MNRAIAVYACEWQVVMCRITGHTYLTYGPLLNGAATVVFEGVPSYPNAGRVWEVVAKYKVALGALLWLSL